MVGKLCGLFTRSCLTLPWHGGNGTAAAAASVPSVDLSLGPGWDRADLICTLFCMSILTCVGLPAGLTQVLVSVWTNAELRPEKLNALFKKAAKQTNNPQMPRQEMKVQIYNRPPKAWETMEKLRKILWEIRTFKGIHAYKE